MLRFVFLLLTLAPLVAAVPSADPAFDRWAEAFAADWVRLSPEQATSTQYFAGAEQAALDRRLEPVTAQHSARRVELARRGLADLARWAGAPLSAGQRVSAAVMRWQLERTVASAPFEAHRFEFRQFSGLHTRLVDTLTERHPLRHPADLETYVARLGEVAPRIDEGITEARAAARRGLVAPRYIIDRSLAQLDIFLAAAPAENVFVTALAKRAAEIPDAAGRAAAVRRAEEIVATAVIPAYGRVRALLRELRGEAPAEGGLARLPDGAAAYAQALALYTTTSMSAEEIHALGRREVERIEAEQDALLRQAGFAEGSLEQRRSAATAAPALPDDPDPRAAVIAQFTAHIRDAERRSAALFNRRPRAPVEVRRVPPMKEAAAAASYTLPAPDGSQPGVVWLPLRGPRFFPPSRSLAYHEGVPGHHFQLAIMQEMEGLPRFRSRRVFGGGSAISEGWALYTERLAIEAGWYEGDLRGQLVALNSLLFRARRLVTDTGLHAQQWTRKQAIDYGISPSEVERYVVWPGQACSYYVGMQRIIELRERARTALGPRFSLPAFHDVVLESGSVPLDVLGSIVDAWLADHGAGVPGAR